MADSTWKEDENLKQAMTKLAQQRLQRIEALDFRKRDFPEYSWSMRTLDRRLRHFDIFYNDKSVILYTWSHFESLLELSPLIMISCRGREGRELSSALLLIILEDKYIVITMSFLAQTACTHCKARYMQKRPS